MARRRDRETGKKLRGGPGRGAKALGTPKALPGRRGVKVGGTREVTVASGKDEDAHGSEEGYEGRAGGTGAGGDGHSAEHREEVAAEEGVVVYRFDRAFLRTLVYLAAFTIVVFIPAMGALLLFTVAPYAAGHLGNRDIPRMDALLAGALAGVVWTLVQIYVIFVLVVDYLGFVGQVDLTGSLELALLASMFCGNTFFCGLGGYRAGIRL